MDLVFVDVETTGLDPERHELIEVAAVRVLDQGWGEVA
jgi:DNA polymerase III epsilon subunit-like protein